MATEYVHIVNFAHLKVMLLCVSFLNFKALSH